MRKTLSRAGLPCGPSSVEVDAWLGLWLRDSRGLLAAVERLDQGMPKVPSTLDAEKSDRTLHTRRLKSKKGEMILPL